MGLRHVRNRVLQVTVDAPAAGISKIGSGLSADSRIARRTEIDHHVAERKADRERRDIEFEAAVAIKKAEILAERAVKQAEHDQRVAEAKARLEAKRLEDKARAEIETVERQRRLDEEKAQIEARVRELLIEEEERKIHAAARARVAADQAAKRQLEAEALASQRAEKAAWDAAEAKLRQGQILMATAQEDFARLQARQTLGSPSKASDSPAPPATLEGSTQPEYIPEDDEEEIGGTSPIDMQVDAGA